MALKGQQTRAARALRWGLLNSSGKAIAELRNLGPAMQRMLGEIDIHYENDLAAAGSVAAFARLKFRFGRRVSLNALYAMEASLRGCDWRAIDAETKHDLKASYEALKFKPE